MGLSFKKQVSSHVVHARLLPYLWDTPVSDRVSHTCTSMHIYMLVFLKTEICYFLYHQNLYSHLASPLSHQQRVRRGSPQRMRPRKLFPVWYQSFEWWTKKPERNRWEQKYLFRALTAFGWCVAIHDGWLFERSQSFTLSSPDPVAKSCTARRMT